jgi:CO/xanthine dehydrogenase FAD-binding subunit
LGTLRFEVLQDYPEVVINLKTISGLDYIREDGSQLTIGALARLEDIARDATVKNRYPAFQKQLLRQLLLISGDGNHRW